MIRILGLALYGPLAASHRIRLSQYKEGLWALGIDLQVQSLMGNEYLQNSFRGERRLVTPILSSSLERLRLLLRKNDHHAVIVHCELFPLMPGWLEVTLLRKPFIYDFDDAFFLRYRHGRLSSLSCVLGEKFDYVMKRAAAITAGSRYLSEYATKFNSEVSVLPSVVDTERFCPAGSSNTQPFTIGWIGSPSTAPYLQQLVEPLRKLATEAPIRLVVIGGKAPYIPNIEVFELPWEEHTEVQLINTFDVGVMPLPDDDWARGKCAFKLVQYMACGLPVVASRVGANIDLITPGSGFLVETDDEWITALSILLKQPSLRQQMGRQGRERIVKHYSLSANLPFLAKIIHKVAGFGELHHEE